jgi:uncharacterized membrane protein
VSDSHEVHKAKTISWLVVLVIIIGSVVGTVGVCVASWTLGIIGAAIMVVGGIVGLAAGIMEDVDEATSNDLWPLSPRDASRRRQISS